jgi:hypothetical protein
VVEPAVKATFRAARDSRAFSRSLTQLADLPPHPLLPLSDDCTLKRKHMDSTPEVLITEQSFNHGGKKHKRNVSKGAVGIVGQFRIPARLGKEKNVKKIQ